MNFIFGGNTDCCSCDCSTILEQKRSEVTVTRQHETIPSVALSALISQEGNVLVSSKLGEIYM